MNSPQACPKVSFPLQTRDAHFRVSVGSQSPFYNSHPARTWDTDSAQRTDGKFPSNLTFPTPSPQLSTHLPRLSSPEGRTQDHLGMPAGSQFMMNGPSTHAHGRSGREKKAVPTGCLCRAGETQKDSLVPEFLPHRRCKRFRVPTASAGVSSSSQTRTPFYIHAQHAGSMQVLSICLPSSLPRHIFTEHLLCAGI